MPEDMKHWFCRIGEVPRDRELKLLSREGARNGDRAMRDAVTAGYVELTGEEPVYIFSGWGDDLPERYRAVVEDREPVDQTEAMLDELEATMRHVMLTRNGWSIGDATAKQIRDRFRFTLYTTGRERGERVERIEWRVSWQMWMPGESRPRRVERITDDEVDAREQLTGLLTMVAPHDMRPCGEHVWGPLLERRVVYDNEWEPVS